jgi:hypothetical protein
LKRFLNEIKSQKLIAITWVGWPWYHC